MKLELKLKLLTRLCGFWKKIAKWLRHVFGLLPGSSYFPGAQKTLLSKDSDLISHGTQAPQGTAVL